MWTIAFALLAVAAAEVDPAEEKALQARRSIQSGELQIQSVDYIVKGDGNELVVERTVQYILSFKGDKLRTLQSAGHVESGDSFAVFAREEGLSSEGRLYRRDYDLSQPDVPTAIPVATIDHIESWIGLRKHVVDPRLFGIQPVPFGILHSCSYEEFLTNPMRTETSGEDTTFEGQPVRLVTVTRPGMNARMWISPEQGWNLVRAELFDANGPQAVLTNKLARFGDIWFPQEVVFEEFDSQMKLIDKNVATVMEANFNQPIPDENFTLASLHPVKGAIVFNAASPGQALGQWDGESLIPFRDKSRMPALPPDAAKRDGMLSFFLVNLLAGAAILVLIYYRTRTAKAG